MPPTFILSQNQTLQFFLLKPLRARLPVSRTERRDALNGIVSQKRNGLMVCGNRRNSYEFRNSCPVTIACAGLLKRSQLPNCQRSLTEGVRVAIGPSRSDS